MKVRGWSGARSGAELEWIGTGVERNLSGAGLEWSGAASTIFHCFCVRRPEKLAAPLNCGQYTPLLLRENGLGAGCSSQASTLSVRSTIPVSL